MRRIRLSPAVVLIVFPAAAAAGTGAAVGCSAVGSKSNPFEEGGAGPASSAASVGGGGAATGGAPGSGGAGGMDSAGTFSLPDAGADANPDVMMNPCGTECGPEELCDDAHLGLDDDCDGDVDERCLCSSGQAHSCFKGDPSYRNDPGCFPGTERCDESGHWGPCIGGIHATESCYSATTVNCHPLQASPFADVNLKEGTGAFSSNAVAGTEVWTVACPQGVDPCPAVTGMNPPDDFKPLQSGEYTVTYTKGVPGGGTESCTYPLFIGARGLRVELEWEHDLGGSGVDLDLHLHQPGTTAPWAISGSPADCGFANCTIDDFLGSNPEIRWFSDSAMPPAPVNWYLDSMLSNNSCFYAPRGAGQRWQTLGRGCHNPRLDIDNITCNPAVTEPNDPRFCAPENINVDYPPLGAWTRVGVHYYSSHGLNYAVHPRIKIFCNGALAADLGLTGYYEPEAPVTFAPEDTSSRFWLVADVAFTDAGVCGEIGCSVVPLYMDPITKTPYLTTQSAVVARFGPPYPPTP